MVLSMCQASNIDQETQDMARVFLFCVVWLEKGSMIFEQKCFGGIEIELLFSEIRKTVEE